MKTKATRKDIRFLYDTILECNELGHLVAYKNPRFYNCGVYGWNWDCYSFGDVAIIKGYRNQIGKRVSYDLQHEYNEKAESIIRNRNISFAESERLLDKLIKEFIIVAMAE